MLKNAIAYAEIFGVYANICKFCICGIIFAYTILKMPLYVEKYAIFGFWQNMRSHMRWQGPQTSRGPVKLYPPPQWACGLMFHMHFRYSIPEIVSLLWLQFQVSQSTSRPFTFIFTLLCNCMLSCNVGNLVPGTVLSI